MKMRLATAVVMMSWSLAQAASIPDFPFVFATGRSETNLPPDTARMTFDIKAFHEDSSNAVAKVTTRTAAVIDFLGRQGFGKSTLTSSELGKSEIREKKEDRELKVIGYEVTRSFELIIENLTKYDLVANTLFKMDNVSEISTSFGRKDQKEIEAKLLGTACADAKRNADAMASGFGKKIGTVHCISKQGFGNIGMAFGLGADAFDGRDMMSCMEVSDEKASLFIPATVKFQNQVSVLFTLDKK